MPIFRNSLTLFYKFHSYYRLFKRVCLLIVINSRVSRIQNDFNTSRSLKQRNTRQHFRNLRESNATLAEETSILYSRQAPLICNRNASNGNRRNTLETWFQLSKCPTHVSDHHARIFDQLLLFTNPLLHHLYKAKHLDPISSMLPGIKMNHRRVPIISLPKTRSLVSSYANCLSHYTIQSDVPCLSRDTWPILSYHRHQSNTNLILNSSQPPFSIINFHYS